MLRNLTIIATTVVALLLFASPVYSDTLYPTDDTYTPDDTGGQSHGAETDLLVANFAGAGKYDRSMLLFDLSSYMGQTVTTATFYIYQFFHCPTGTPCNCDFYHATEEWDESWSGGHVNHDSTVWVNEVFTSTLGYYDIEVTGLIQAWLDGDMANYGFVMHSRDGSKYGKFYSNDNASNKPYLELGTTGIESESLGAIKATFR